MSYISSFRVLFLSSAKCMGLTSDKIGKEEEKEEHIPEKCLSRLV